MGRGCGLGGFAAPSVSGPQNKILHMPLTAQMLTININFWLLNLLQAKNFSGIIGQVNMFNSCIIKRWQKPLGNLYHYYNCFKDIHALIGKEIEVGTA